MGYYENSGEFIGHYISWLKEWARERDVTFGDHYLPHDGDRESLVFRPQVVARPKIKGEAIAAARTIFSTCQFDESACDLGLKRLRHYRDAFITFACSSYEPPRRYKEVERDLSWVV